jgi:hypothetical protein
VTNTPLAGVDKSLNTTTSTFYSTSLAQEMFEGLLPNNSDKLHPSLLYNQRRFGTSSAILDKILPYLSRPPSERTEEWTPPTSTLGIGSVENLPHYRFNGNSIVNHPKLGHCSILNEICAIRGDLDDTWEGWDHRRGATKEYIKQKDRTPWYVNAVLWIGTPQEGDEKLVTPSKIISIWCALG